MALVLVGALVLAGCARSPLTAPHGTNSPAKSISAPAPTPSAAGVSDLEAIAVGNLVNAYLEADSNRDFEAMASMTTGTIKQFWLWYYAELGTCTCPVEPLTIDHIRVEKVVGRTATVDILATLQAEDHTATITGPMRLVKTAGWYIADYQRNGVDFARTIAPRHGGVRSAGGIDVQVIGINRDGAGEEVWFRITNNRLSDIALVLFEAAAGTVALRRYMWRPGISDIMTGFVVAQIEWTAPHPLKPGTPLQIHLLFRDLGTGAPVTIDTATRS
jgi:hypothetical protein